MDPSPLLPWFRSFDGVTPEVLPSVNHIIEGFAVCYVFNKLQDAVKIDVSKLSQVNREKDDFVHTYKNLKFVCDQMKEQLSAAKCKSQFDILKIAKNKNQESINELINALIVFSLKGPKAELGKEIYKKLDKETKAAIGNLAEEMKNKKAASKASSAKESSTHDIIKKKYEGTLEQLKQENEMLKKENQALKDNKTKIENKKKDNVKVVQKSKEQIDYEETCKNKEQVVQEGQKLDLEIKELGDVESEKNRMRLELNTINGKIKDLEKKKENETKSIESYQNSTDPKVIKLLTEIKKEEEKLSPKYIEHLQSSKAKLQKQLNKLSAELNDFNDLVDDTSEDDTYSKLTKEIEKIIDENNNLNSEIAKMLVQADNIDRLKDNHSFIQHLRSSSLFIK